MEYKKNVNHQKTFVKIFFEKISWVPIFDVDEDDIYHGWLYDDKEEQNDGEF